jgi:hypothetical protein
MKMMTQRLTSLLARQSDACGSTSMAKTRIRKFAPAHGRSDPLRPDPLRPVEAHARASRCAQRCISDPGIRWDRPGRRRRAVVGRVGERALPRPAAAALLRRRSAPRAAPRRPAPPHAADGRGTARRRAGGGHDRRAVPGIRQGPRRAGAPPRPRPAPSANRCFPGDEGPNLLVNKLPGRR